MIRLFPNSKAFLALGEALAFLAGMALYHDGFAWPVVLGVWAALALVAYLGVSAYAVQLHSRLLSVLYLYLKPQEFINAYEPLLHIPGVRKNIRFRMQNYLVSACCAAGDFEKAMQVLDEMPILQGKAEAPCRSVIAKGRCRCALYGHDMEEAKKQLLLAEKYETEKANDTALLSAQMAVAENCVTAQSIELIRAQTKAARLPLLKNELRLWLGNAYAAKGEQEFANGCWQEVADGAENLYYAKLARDCLAKSASRFDGEGKSVKYLKQTA